MTKSESPKATCSLCAAPKYVGHLITPGCPRWRALPKEVKERRLAEMKAEIAAYSEGE